MIDALVDTGFIYALFDASDDDHKRCVQAVQLPAQKIFLSVIVLPEFAYLIRRNLGAGRVAEYVRLLRQPPWLWLNPELEDYDRAADIMEQYKDARLDLVDCVLAAMAERMAIKRLLTLDTRDFTLIRPRHCPAFELLP